MCAMCPQVGRLFSYPLKGIKEWWKMAGLLTARIRDNSDEYSNVSFLVEDLVTLDVWDDVETLAAALEAAIEGMIIGTLVSVHFRQIANTVDDTRPANAFAQREVGVRFFYSDDVTGQKYNVTVATPDLTAVATPGSDEVLLTDAEIAPMVTFIEGSTISPDGNAVTVDRAVIVGRNS